MLPEVVEWYRPGKTLLQDGILGIQGVMHTRDLAVAFITLSLELAQALGKRSTGAAAAFPSWAGNGPHIPSSIDRNVWEGEEDITLATSGLRTMCQRLFRKAC